MNLKPLPGRVLVELREKYSHVATTEQKYDTKTSGICLRFSVKIPKSETDIKAYISSYEVLVDKLIFWEEYKNSEPIERAGKKYAFVKIEDINGFEDVETQ